MLQPQVMREAARNFLATHNDRPIGHLDSQRAREAIDIAQTWIDAHTQFPASTTNSDVAWSRKEWIDHSISGWQKLVEPLAEGMVQALAKVLKEMGAESFDPGQIEGLEGMDPSTMTPFGPLGAMAGQGEINFLPIMRTFMGQMIAQQLGTSIGALSTSLTASHDVAIPLFSKPALHLIPQNIAQWGEGLEIPEQEIYIYIALREVAAQRLFAHTPWLADYIRDQIASYGQGITVDIESIQRQAESAMSSGELDITNPDSITLAINQGMFQPEESEAQSNALAKLEMTFALIEGWVDHITNIAARDRLPSLSALHESYRRSRIESAPTQQLFSMLLGLQISPRKSRECAQFWNEIYAITYASQGDAESAVEIRDHRWEDAALLPTASDLSDPAKFLASTTVPDDLSGLM
jgi:putative hydrolase